MPCVGKPCASAETRWLAVASAMRSFAPARFRAVLASSNSACALFFTARILTMGKMIQLTAADGHKLDAYCADPANKPRGAIVVIQEIFGVNSHIKSVTDGFAADGYVAIAPAMFDRVQRGYDTGYSPADIEAGRALMQKLDWKQTMLDVDAAVAEAKKNGKVGIVGYCWGGTVAWRAAASTPGLACSVPYYGGGMPNFISEKPKIPVMCNFGELDQSPTLEQ